MLAQKGGRPKRSDYQRHMSYLRSRYRPRKRMRPLPQQQAIGDIASAIEALFTGAGSAISTAGNIANDPYLPEVACRVNQLHAIKSNQTVPACADTPPGLPGGVGLSDAVVPLRIYVYAKQNPWVFPLAAFAILGLPFWVGYSMGGSK